MTFEIDKIDQKIIEILKTDAKTSNREIAKKTKLPVTTVFNRIRRLEKNCVIRGYSAVLDYKKLGLKLTAYSLLHYNISIWGKETSRAELKRQLMALPNIEEVKYIIGQYDILLKFRVRDMDDFNDILLNKLRGIPGIGQTETFIVLEDVV